MSNWVGPNSERQKPVLVLGTETRVGERLPRRKPAPAPVLEVIPGVESPAIYDGFNHKGSVILARPRRDMAEVHVYDASTDQEPGKTARPIGYFKAPAAAGKDTTTYPGEFAHEGNPPVPARLLFDGARIEISFETQVPAPPAPVPPPATKCVVPEPVPVNSRFGKKQANAPAPMACVEPPPAPKLEPRQETTTLKFVDRRTLVSVQKP